ncbi:MAG: hypothetical protein SangKO_073380 [Sandaracinaceae bacterium]|nr:MAG: low molecular weight phosphotyrosine protein phosphatase [Sandaracinaceae bacterium]
MSDPIRVCFVCLGNICRSPTAEAVFLDLIEREGVAARFAVDSAGTGSWHVGERAHPDTRAAAEARGIEIRSVARQWKAADFDRFDYVVVMDTSNRDNVLALARSDADRKKVHLFRDFDADGDTGQSVPDPYYEGGFGLVYDICEAAAKGLLAQLRREHAI